MSLTLLIPLIALATIGALALVALVFIGVIIWIGHEPAND